MDYIFEDDLFEVGAEVDAYCTRCKTDTPHTVLTKYEDEIRSVLCTTCNTSHAYRPPRGDTEEEIPEPISVRRRQALQKLSWSAAMEQVDTSASLPYSPRECYIEGQVLEHPTFGVGYVSEVLSDTKLEAIFEDGNRLLVHNRVDLPDTKPAKKATAKGSKKKAPIKVLKAAPEDSTKKAAKKQAKKKSTAPEVGSKPKKAKTKIAERAEKKAEKKTEKKTEKRAEKKTKKEPAKKTKKEPAKKKSTKKADKNAKKTAKKSAKKSAEKKAAKKKPTKKKPAKKPAAKKKKPDKKPKAKKEPKKAKRSKTSPASKRTRARKKKAS
jgi:chemotaxis protein histidine kinase CheA